MTIRTLIASTLFLALALSGCSKNGPLTANAIGDFIGGPAGQGVKAAGHELNAISLSEKDEDNIGQAVGVELTNQYGVYAGDRIQTYVTLVGFTVANASTNPDGNYVFGVLDTSEVNAFSGPNGYVFVTRGALENMRSEAELAGVLAHEIAHVCHHDGLHQVEAAEQQAAARDALSAYGPAQQFAALADAGVDVITKTGYTQPQEFSADEDGVKFMSAAGYNPHAYLQFLQRLQQLQGASAGGKIMSTHPGIGDRVARVNKEIAQMKKTGSAILADRFDRWVALAR